MAVSIIYNNALTYRSSFFQRNVKVPFGPNVCVSSTFRRKESMDVVLRLRHFHCRALESSGLPCCIKACSNFVGFLIKQHWRLWFLMPSLEFMSEARIHLWRELSDSSELNRKKKNIEISVTLPSSPSSSEERWRTNPPCRWGEVKRHQAR